jgi:hypothetical protein
MIKELIKDITFDNISLTQALMRAKLIAFEVNNEDFKNWINNELNGYSKDSKLPDYRIIPCDIFAVIEGYGARKMVPMDLTELDKDLEGKVYKMEAKQSIATIEDNLKMTRGEQYGYEDFSQQMVAMLREMTNNQFIVSVKRRVQLSQAAHILNLTKQKLINTLLELNNAFPDLQNNFQNNQENKEKTDTIINNHIYGNYASSNIGIGDNITQTISSTYNQKISQLVSELERIGVHKEDIVEVKNIVQNEPNKASLSKKLMSWVGKLATKAIEKGIDLQIPMIIEKINHFQ